MEISSRTPEGERNTCPICGKDVWMVPSLDTRDATCPHCGSLLWFDEVPAVTDGTIEQLKIRDRVFGLALQKFGWPIAAAIHFVALVPKGGGSQWLEILDRARSWYEFGALLMVDDLLRREPRRH